MKIHAASILSITLLLSASLAVTPAFADAGDKAACASLDEGDDCTDSDNEPGICIPDESDASVLSCDDDAYEDGGAGGTGSGGSGCSTSGSADAPFGGLLIGLGAIVTARLRRRAMSPGAR